MSRIATLLAKDLRILRRSPTLLLVLAVYPVLLAGLVAVVTRSAGERPRVALVDRAGLPDRIRLGQEDVDVGRLLDDVRRRVELVELDEREAAEALEAGRVVATLTVPPGFVLDVQSGFRSPEIVLATRDGTVAERAARETQALVFALNSAFGRELLRQNVEYLGLLVTGGRTRVLGQDVEILGLERTSQLVEQQLARTEDPVERERLAAIREFAQDAEAALGLADNSLEATAHPVVLVERRVGGEGSLLANRAVAIVLAVGVVLVGVLLGAGAVAAERDENVVGRLVRGPVRLSALIAEKVLLVALLSVALGVLLAGAYLLAAAAFGFDAPPATRLAPLVGVLVPTGCAVGAVGVLIGVVVRDLVGGALVAVLVTLPFVLAGVVPRGVAGALDTASAAFPFAPAVEGLTGVLYDAGPGTALLAAAGHLGALAVLYAGAARLLAHRLQT